jgi:tRNA U38,U39,U40 pseudouridine synthase TruA
MIGLLIHVISLNKTEEYFNNAFMNNKMYIWLAPPDGLYLERIIFNGYNIKSDVKIKLEHDQNTE